MLQTFFKKYFLFHLLKQFFLRVLNKKARHKCLSGILKFLPKRLILIFKKINSITAIIGINRKFTDSKFLKNLVQIIDIKVRYTLLNYTTRWNDLCN